MEVRLADMIGEVREITEADLERLTQDVKWPVVKEVTHRHHRIAWRLAAGEKPIEIARDLGYTPAYLSVLMRSPAMEELIQLYQEELREQDFTLHSRIHEVSAELLDRLHEAALAGDLPPKDLREATKDLLDRSGYAPKRESTKNVRHTFAIEELRAIKETARESVVGSSRSEAARREAGAQGGASARPCIRAAEDPRTSAVGEEEGG